LAQDEQAWIDSLVAPVAAAATAADGTLSAEALRAEPVAVRRRILRRWLRRLGVPEEAGTFETVERADRLLAGRGGSARVPAGGGRFVLREYDRLRVGGGETAPFRRRIPLRGEVRLAAPPLRIVTHVAPGAVKDSPAGPGRLPARASLRLAAIGRRHVVVRSWRPGDRIAPLGLAGSKKVQDIFVDAKVPVLRRGAVPLVVCGGRIAWIPGYRVARGFEVRDPAAPALQITIERPDGG
jgi:tRNA(Ile)-lysidine synthase